MFPIKKILHNLPAKAAACCLLLFFNWVHVEAQSVSPGALRNEYAKAGNDSARYMASVKLYNYYDESNRDSALYYARMCLLYSENHGRKLNMAITRSHIAYQLLHIGRYGESLQSLLDAYKIAEDPDSEKFFWVYDSIVIPHRKRIHALSYTHNIHGILMSRIQNTEEEIYHFTLSKKLALEINNPVRLCLADMNLGRIHIVIKKYDTALEYEKAAERTAFQSGFTGFLGFIYALQGIAYLNKHDTAQAKTMLHTAIGWADKELHYMSFALACFELAKLYVKDRNKDSALYYARKAMEMQLALRATSNREFNLSQGYEVLSQAFELRGQRDSVYKYQVMALHAKDSIYRSRFDNVTAFHHLTLKESIRLQHIEEEKKIYQQQVRTYALLIGFVILLSVAVFLWRNNRQRKRINQNLKDALDNLHATQSQLIHSEKMASLGELTAGIAHEIQNPLNFINNFSELNKELLEEMKVELGKGNTTDAADIAADVISNEEKISHHGKRADAIVKGMLQHSRSRSGTREPTDINALAEEYLRLAYHGLRAKNKFFTATLNTDFDPALGKIDVISQDIGRVLLNLVTNAFYAVDKKKQTLGEGFEPVVSVSTKKCEGMIEISVRDNGEGIPQPILDKIFQPFFTTKPTGEGTGLGLSLGYDIVKAHGGNLLVETVAGEHTIFTIQLPLS